MDNIYMLPFSHIKALKKGLTLAINANLEDNNLFQVILNHDFKNSFLKCYAKSNG